MNPLDRTARTAGILFLLTFVSAITGAALYAPLLSDPGYVTGPGADTRILFGAVCELVLIIANIGTAVVLYPVLRRYSPAAAVGYIAARIMECALIAVGILCVLTVVSLRQTGDAATYLPVAQAIVALHGWTFLLGPGFVVGIGNGLLLGFLMYRSRLVPRPMALFGLVGGPLMSLSGIAVLLGAYGQMSVPSALATMPEIIWEVFLGVYLTAIGFRIKRGVGARAAAPVPPSMTHRSG
ncbi:MULTISPECIES: DUF4386 domain-containing protein [Arthrobacter]|uniref:DUF4386 domain-containing protein n=1 Tax=Arthrobacter TaxID=1663 RepID=UPI0009E69E2D|nr:DUF4386 domain-containing protein [Arthrobacter sp. Edens01]